LLLSLFLLLFISIKLKFQQLLLSFNLINFLPEICHSYLMIGFQLLLFLFIDNLYVILLSLEFQPFLLLGNCNLRFACYASLSFLSKRFLYNLFAFQYSVIVPLQIIVYVNERSVLCDKFVDLLLTFVMHLLHLLVSFA
jgi:hypothetical protein